MLGVEIHVYLPSDGSELKLREDVATVGTSLAVPGSPGLGSKFLFDLLLGCFFVSVSSLLLVLWVVELGTNKETHFLWMLIRILTALQSQSLGSSINPQLRIYTRGWESESRSVTTTGNAPRRNPRGLEPLGSPNLRPRLLPLKSLPRRLRASP